MSKHTSINLCGLSLVVFSQVLGCSPLICISLLSLPESWVGKSPAYVAYYTDAYKAKMERLQFRYAVNGCVTWGIVNFGIFGCLTVVGSL